MFKFIHFPRLFHGGHGVIFHVAQLNQSIAPLLTDYVRLHLDHTGKRFLRVISNLATNGNCVGLGND